MNRMSRSFNYKKLAIIAGITIGVVSAIGIFALNKLNNKTTEAYGAVNNQLSVEEKIEIVKEQVVSVAQDAADKAKEEETAVEEEKKEEVITYKEKKVKVPKATVAPVNSAEDSEKNKKTGGDAVNQTQANEMFQNVGAKSSGIDVSQHQGAINWAAVKNDGVDFAMIRVGFRGQTAGAIYEDTYFKTNVAGAVANGIKVGIYFYSTAVNENEALEEAAWVVSKIKTYRITYPVVYDFEDFGAYRCAGVSGAQASNNALTFLNFVSSAGYEPMLYANKSDISSRFIKSSFGCKFWLAHYTSGGLSNPSDYKGSYQMWQYTSKGRVNGINGNVDMNVAYFSYGTTAAPKHEHNFSDVVKNSEKAATCTTDGTRTLRCACGDTQTEVLPKLGHKFSDWKTTVKATCYSEGVQERICSTCNGKDTLAIKKLEHNWDNGTEKEAPTCKKEGLKVFKCKNTNCTETKEEVIEKIEHKWNKETVLKEATCTEEGKRKLECSVCNTKKEEVIEKVEHNWNESIDTEATCTAEGVKSFVCDDCGARKEEKIPKKGHDWKSESLIPTCTTAGYNKKICKNCGIEENEELPPKGHTPGDYVPSTTSPDKEESRCTVCNEIVNIRDKAE